MKRSVRGAGIIVIAVSFFAALSGCATTTSASPSPTVTLRPSASPTPGPAASVLPLPAGALFQINAVATASNGAIADLEMIAYLPTAATAGQVALLDSQCNYPGDAAAQGQQS
jgi:hypothetical protein